MTQDEFGAGAGLGGGPPRRGSSLKVLSMALALVFAAFLGAAAGLVWQSSGLGAHDDQDAASEQGEQPGAA